MILNTHIILSQCKILHVVHLMSMFMKFTLEDWSGVQFTNQRNFGYKHTYTCIATHNLNLLDYCCKSYCYSWKFIHENLKFFPSKNFSSYNINIIHSNRTINFCSGNCAALLEYSRCNCSVSYFWEQNFHYFLSKILPISNFAPHTSHFNLIYLWIPLIAILIYLTQHCVC